MTHEQILTEFTLNNFREGDLVEVLLDNGSILTGELSDRRVFVDNPETGENSRIGLLPPTPPPGVIINRQPTTIYSNRVIRINRVI